VVWWSEILVADPEVSGSIPGATNFLGSSGPGRGPFSLMRIIEELLK
jgi:hypothetical protein